jgi:hypothetical protein
MNAFQALELQCDAYQAYFLNRARQLRGKEGMLEALFESESRVPDRLHRLMRADHAEERDHRFQFKEFHLPSPVLSAPVVEHMGGWAIEVRPFLWHRCLVQVLAERFDRQALVTWGSHWIDEEDTRHPKENGLRECIHHVSPPSYPNGKLTFFVDFGTAPLQAAKELIRIIMVDGNEGTIRFGREF